MGVEQTEIDALVALRPTCCVSLLRDAAAPFFDETLAGRADEAEARWRIAAQTRIDAALDEDELASLQERAEQAVAELHAVDDELDELVSGDVDLGGFDQAHAGDRERTGIAAARIERVVVGEADSAAGRVEGLRREVIANRYRRPRAVDLPELEASRLPVDGRPTT